MESAWLLDLCLAKWNLFFVWLRDEQCIRITITCLQIYGLLSSSASGSRPALTDIECVTNFVRRCEKRQYKTDPSKLECVIHESLGLRNILDPYDPAARVKKKALCILFLFLLPSFWICLIHIPDNLDRNRKSPIHTNSKSVVSSDMIKIWACLQVLPDPHPDQTEDYIFFLIFFGVLGS